MSLQHVNVGILTFFTRLKASSRSVSLFFNSVQMTKCSLAILYHSILEVCKNSAFFGSPLRKNYFYSKELKSPKEMFLQENNSLKMTATLLPLLLIFNLASKHLWGDIAAAPYGKAEEAPPVCIYGQSLSMTVLK